MTQASPDPKERHDTGAIDCHDTDDRHTLIVVTGKSGRGTARQTIRADEELWKKFGEVVGEDRRSVVLRDFMKWIVREPGAKMPRRPTHSNGADQD